MRSALTASATVESASAMEATSTVEPASAVEFSSTTDGLSAVKAAAGVAACISPVVASGITTSYEARPTAPASAPSWATIPAATPECRGMTPVIPGTRANKHAAYEIVRPVVPVGRASIRIIIIVSIRTDRRTSGHVARPNSDSNSHPDLRLRIRQWHHQHRQQRQIFHVTHTHLPPWTSHPLFGWIQEPFQSCYLFERQSRRKVAESGVADFNHLA